MPLFCAEMVIHPCKVMHLLSESKKPNPESCVRPERSGAVNTTHVEQAREDRRR